MDELYFEEFQRIKKSVAVDTVVTPSRSSSSREEHTPFGYFRMLEQAIRAEGKNGRLFHTLLQDVERELNDKNYAKVFFLLDEIEEFLDLELLKK